MLPRLTVVCISAGMPAKAWLSHAENQAYVDFFVITGCLHGCRRPLLVWLRPQKFEADVIDGEFLAAHGTVELAGLQHEKV